MSVALTLTPERAAALARAARAYGYPALAAALTAALERRVAPSGNAAAATVTVPATPAIRAAYRRLTAALKHGGAAPYAGPLGGAYADLAGTVALAVAGRHPVASRPRRRGLLSRVLRRLI